MSGWSLGQGEIIFYDLMYSQRIHLLSIVQILGKDLSLDKHMDVPGTERVDGGIQYQLVTIGCL